MVRRLGEWDERERVCEWERGEAVCEHVSEQAGERECVRGVPVCT